MVLRLNQEIRAHRLHVHGADCTRCHPTSRSPGHRVHDLCDHLQSSAPGLLLLPRSSSLHAMPHLSLVHHETSKRDSPNEIKIKEKQNKTIPNLNSDLTKSMTHHNQTKELTTWFLNYIVEHCTCYSDIRVSHPSPLKRNLVLRFEKEKCPNRNNEQSHTFSSIVTRSLDGENEESSRFPKLLLLQSDCSIVS
jgi:hypothetical protein